MQVISCWPLTSKSTHIFFLYCFRLWKVLDLCIQYFSPDIDKMTFSLEKAIQIEDFSHTQRFEVRNSSLNDGFVSYKQAAFHFSLHKMLIDGLESCGLLVDYCDVFISCLDSHSDGTHSLQMIHWWAIMLHFSKSVHIENCKCLQIWWRNKLIGILGRLRVNTFSANFHFWVNYSFKYLTTTQTSP